LYPQMPEIKSMRRVRKVEYITCRLIGKSFTLIVATLPSTLVLYLLAVLV